MALDTYTNLQKSIADWVHRSNDASLTVTIPDIIALAEGRINVDLKARQQDTVTMLVSVSGVNAIALPVDFIEVRSLLLPGLSSTPLDYMVPDALATTYASNYAGQPRAYTIIGTNLYFGPVPDSAYSVQLIYRARVPALGNAVGAQTNWLLTSFPQIYLSAALCEVCVYTQDEEHLPIWEKKYSDAIATVNGNDWFTGSTMRTRTDVRY